MVGPEITILTLRSQPSRNGIIKLGSGSFPSSRKMCHYTLFPSPTLIFLAPVRISTFHGLAVINILDWEVDHVGEVVINRHAPEPSVIDFHLRDEVEVT